MSEKDEVTSGTEHESTDEKELSTETISEEELNNEVTLEGTDTTSGTVEDMSEEDKSNVTKEKK